MYFCRTEDKGILFNSSMKIQSNFLLTVILVISVFIGQAKDKDRISPGAESTDLYFPLLKGKNIAVVANHTAVLGHGHLVDSLVHSGFKVKRVFAPEHGFRGESGAGDKIANGKDPVSGLPIISLYGKHLKPTAKDLEGINVVIFDIQDVGVRFYTYISTLQYVMEACAENHIKLIVLDRPNPNGHYVDGPVLNPKFSSFIGRQAVPVVYGMTIGEYAKMLNGEKWLSKKVVCDLTVIPLGNYTHAKHYVLKIHPSPNLPEMDAVYLYPSVCFFEGTKISLGRGTTMPFRLIGYPGMKEADTSFTPRSIKGVSENPPYKDTLCSGVSLANAGYSIRENGAIHLEWLIKMYKSYPAKEKFFTPFFTQLAGTDVLQKQIMAGKSEAEIKASWQKDLSEFKKIRKKYLLYPDVLGN